ncbi:MAG TPA: ferrous iron transport protein B, partial [Gemmatimonadaceae bacterium]|nr:ferrous iron transport protein B [Gemmatimonadaceae bacterium]
APLQGLLERGGINYAAAGMEALRLLSVRRDEPHLVHVEGLTQKLDAARKAIVDAGYVPERLESELRYTWIGGVLSRCVQRVERTGGSLSDRIDAVLLHRVGGPLIFLAVMALVFQSVFTWAAPVQDLFEAAAVGLGTWVGSFLPEGDFQSLVVDGVFAGVGSVIVFVPQIAILFAFIGLLEQTGYMARAAYLMDRVMRRVGLHGKSFIPMLSGYACAVPGIMATRTIDDPKDRLATIMVVPLMSCSARLPVYTLLIGAFVPALPLLPGLNLQGVTMLVMYLLGTVAALVIAFAFRRTLLKGPVRPMLLELPGYRWPSLGSLLLSVWQRCAVFLQRAGTVILSLSIILWALATYPKASVDETLPETVQQEQQLAHSVLGRFGHAVEPVVAPLGYDWKIGVSIVASFAAREVFVSTMGTIYGVGGEDEAALSERLLAERRPDGSPRYTPLIAVGLMVFYVFALMCISTVAITVREAGGGAIGWRWAAIQFGYMFVLAYAMAYHVIVAGRAMGFAG